MIRCAYAFFYCIYNAKVCINIRIKDNKYKNFKIIFMLSAVHKHMCLGQKEKAADCVLAWGGYMVIKRKTFIIVVKWRFEKWRFISDKFYSADEKASQSIS
jgi:hypothetical protein